MTRPKGFRYRELTAKDKQGNLKTQAIWEWAIENNQVPQTIDDRDKRNHDNFLSAEEIVGTVKPRHREPRTKENVCIVWKNKKKAAQVEKGEHVEKMIPDGLVVVEKQRHGEWEGKINLWY